MDRRLPSGAYPFPFQIHSIARTWGAFCAVFKLSVSVVCEGLVISDSRVLDRLISLTNRPAALLKQESFYYFRSDHIAKSTRVSAMNLPDTFLSPVNGKANRACDECHRKVGSTPAMLHGSYIDILEYVSDYRKPSVIGLSHAPPAGKADTAVRTSGATNVRHHNRGATPKSWSVD